jgi:hypothetical protein
MRHWLPSLYGSVANAPSEPTPEHVGWDAHQVSRRQGQAAPVFDPFEMREVGAHGAAEVRQHGGELLGRGGAGRFSWRMQ